MLLYKRTPPKNTQTGSDMMAVHFYSQDSAQTLASKIVAARTQPDEYFELITVIYVEGKEVAQPPLFVKEVRSSQQLMSGQELINCVTESLRHITILLPHPRERETGIAEVLIQGE